MRGDGGARLLEALMAHGGRGLQALVDLLPPLAMPVGVQAASQPHDGLVAALAAVQVLVDLCGLTTPTGEQARQQVYARLAADGQQGLKSLVARSLGASQPGLLMGYSAYARLLMGQLSRGDIDRCKTIATLMLRAMSVHPLAGPQGAVVGSASGGKRAPGA